MRRASFISILVMMTCWPAFAAEQPRMGMVVTTAGQETAWLGVMLQPIPSALKAHLGLDEQGLMIRNIHEGSPADKVGLERWDVIVEVDGKQVAGGTEGFSRYIHSKKPGDELALTLYRQGKKQEMTLTLGEGPARRGRAFIGKLKYPCDGDTNLYGHGSMGMGMMGMPTSRPAETTDLDEARRTDKNGRVLHVLVQENGTIRVRRYTSADGEDKAEDKIYANLAELRKFDPEACDLLRPHPPRPPGGMEPLGDALREYSRHIEELSRKAQEQGEHLKRQADRLKKEYSDRYTDEWAEQARKWRDWAEKFRDLPPQWQEELERFRPRDDEPGPRPNREPEPGPRYRFEVMPNGHIAATVIQPEGELTLTFESEDQLAEKEPELHERFKRMRDRLR